MIITHIIHLLLLASLRNGILINDELHEDRNEIVRSYLSDVYRSKGVLEGIEINHMPINCGGNRSAEEVTYIVLNNRRKFAICCFLLARIIQHIAVRRNRYCQVIFICWQRNTTNQATPGAVSYGGR